MNIYLSVCLQVRNIIDHIATYELHFSILHRFVGLSEVRLLVGEYVVL